MTNPIKHTTDAAPGSTTEGACTFLKHDQGRDTQDEREDTAILTVLVRFTAIAIVGAACFALGWYLA